MGWAPKRCSDKLEQKKALSRFFAETYLRCLLEKKVKLFFESGSTIAYVAGEMAAGVKNKIRIEDGQPNLPSEEVRWQVHQQLAEYFAGLDYWAESLEAQRARARRLPPTPRPANVRKVVELPYHRVVAADTWRDVADRPGN